MVVVVMVVMGVLVVTRVMVKLSISSHALPAFFLCLSLPSLSLLSAPNIPPLHNQTPPPKYLKTEKKRKATTFAMVIPDSKTHTYMTTLLFS